jgi:hypothetical protein
MAIYNSIAIGRARKSIGNVTFVSLKGQKVAKAKIVNPTNPKTPGQLLSRYRMLNIVKAWQFLQIFFAGIGYLRTSVQSNYNVFVHLYKNMVNGTMAKQAWENALSLIPSNLVDSNTATILQAEKTLGVTYDLAIVTHDLPFPGTVANPLKVNGVIIDSVGNQSTATHTITTDEWTAKQIELDFGAFEPNGAAKTGFYIYDQKQTLCSNILFS